MRLRSCVHDAAACDDDTSWSVLMEPRNGTTHWDESLNEARASSLDEFGTPG